MTSVKRLAYIVEFLASVSSVQGSVSVIFKMVSPTKLITYENQVARTPNPVSETRNLKPGT